MPIQNKDIYNGNGKPLSEVIKEFQKWNEEIKKSLELTRRLGDEISNNLRRETNRLNSEATSEQIENVRDLNERLSRQRGETERLTEEQKELERATKQLNRITAQQTREYQQVQAEIIRQRHLQNERNRQMREEARLVGTASDSLARKKQRLSELTREYNSASAEVRNNLAPQIRALRDEIAQAEEAIGNHSRTVGNYGRVWEGFNRIALGVTGVIAVIGGIASAFGALTKRMAVNAIRTRQVANLMGVNREEAKELRNELNALSDAYNIDFRETLRASSALKNNFTLTNNQIVGLIEETAQLATNQDEILDQVREYSTQFAKAGISAKEMIAILIQGERLAVFNDKAPDAIKEATLALAENTEATQKAISALDEQARKEVQRLQATGQYIEAIQLISKEMNKTYLTTSEYQTLVADVFKGAGEDAGQFINQLADLNIELESIVDNTTEAEKASIEFDKALSNIKDSASESTTMIGRLTIGVKELVTETLNWLANISSDNWLESLNALANSINSVFNPLMASGQTVEQLNSYNKALKDVSKTVEDLATKQIEANGELSENVLKGQIDFEVRRAKGAMKLNDEQLDNYRTMLINQIEIYKTNQAQLEKEEESRLDLIFKREMEMKAKSNFEEIEAEKEKQAKLKKVRDDALEERKKHDAEDLKNRIEKADKEIEIEKKYWDLRNRERTIDNGAGVVEFPIPEPPNWDEYWNKDNYKKSAEEIASQMSEDLDATASILTSIYDSYQSVTGDSIQKSAERISEYDSMIADYQSNLANELRKKERGLANTAETEKQKIDELEAKRNEEIEHRRKLARQEQVISKTIQAAKISEAIAKLISSTATNPLTLIAGYASIAAMLVKFADFKTEAKRLKDGEIMIEGAGTTTSDSIPAMLSKKESVINAKGSIASPISLTNINDHIWNDDILVPAVNQYLNGGVENNSYSYDSKYLNKNTTAVNSLADIMKNKQFGTSNSGNIKTIRNGKKI